MSPQQAICTAMECRKLASYFRTRSTSEPISDLEKAGIANLLTGVASLIETFNLSTPESENVLQMVRRPH